MSVSMLSMTYTTIDDFAYLQSFAAQNTLLFAELFLEEFFKKIGTRRVILSPEETVKIGGYTYKGGRHHGEFLGYTD